MQGRTAKKAEFLLPVADYQNLGCGLGVLFAFECDDFTDALLLEFPAFAAEGLGIERDLEAGDLSAFLDLVKLVYVEHDGLCLDAELLGRFGVNVNVGASLLVGFPYVKGPFAFFTFGIVAGVNIGYEF